MVRGGGLQVGVCVAFSAKVEPSDLSIDYFGRGDPVDSYTENDDGFNEH